VSPRNIIKESWLKKYFELSGVVAHFYNSSYSEGSDREDCSVRLSLCVCVCVCVCVCRGKS
jgi:hypothetical protein